MRMLIPLVLLPSVLLAQEAAEQKVAPSPDPVEGLIEQVRAAHRRGETGELDRFRAALRVKSVETGQESIEIDITASFIAPRLLRYRVEESGDADVKERGIDDRGVWVRIGDRVVSASGKDHAKEVELVREQVRLARQLLEFLDPGSVLERLKDVSGPERRELPIERGEGAPCDVVTGVAERFPMFSPPRGRDGQVLETPCRIEAWFDARSHLLTGVLVTPIDGEGRPVGAPEFLLLSDYAEGQDVAVPTRLRVWRGVPWREGKATAAITIRSIDVDPDGLLPATMQRPR